MADDVWVTELCVISELLLPFRTHHNNLLLGVPYILSYSPISHTISIQSPLHAPGPRYNHTTMPPKLTALQPPSPSPPPPTNDAQDLLVIQDIMDTLDQIPPELTRVHSDLNELGAVLYCKRTFLKALSLRVKANLGGCSYSCQPGEEALHAN